MAASDSGSTASEQPSAPATRRHELDVLTTLIVFALVFLHTATIFSGQQLIVNRDQSMAATIVASFAVVFDFLWTMPALMFVAGIAIWYSLERRTAGQFVRERILRLFVPFLTGLAILNPPQVYYYMRTLPGYAESFFQFYLRYWHIKFSVLNFPYFVVSAEEEAAFSVAYLWFLIYLLVYTLVLLPLFLWLRRPSGQQAAARFASIFSRGPALFALGIPIALVEAILAAEWPSGWSRWIWPFVILYGYLAACDARLTHALARRRVLALVLGLIGLLAFFIGVGILGQDLQVDVFTDRGVPAMIVRLIKGLASWFLVIAVVGIATHRGELSRQVAQAATEPGQAGPSADKPTFWARAVAYGREAQLPFYVLHQLPIIVLGYYVVQWQMSPLAKFGVISLASLAFTLLVYEFLVRRIAVVRWLFGMRTKR